MLQFEEAVYAILVQVLMAFAQGASPVLVSRDAILALTADYSAAATRDQSEWNLLAPTVLGWARALGALSAQRALAGSRAVVSRDDYQRSRELASRHSDELLGRCPWTPISA